MSTEDVSVLQSVVDGDASALAVVETWPAHRFTAAVTKSTWLLRPAAVCRVLTNLAHGSLDDARAQRWASTMRWGGYRELGSMAFDVDVDPRAEGPVMDALARLDELGDLVDGEFRPGEINELLGALRGVVSSS